MSAWGHDEHGNWRAVASKHLHINLTQEDLAMVANDVGKIIAEEIKIACSAHHHSPLDPASKWACALCNAGIFLID